MPAGSGINHHLSVGDIIIFGRVKEKINHRGTENTEKFTTIALWIKTKNFP
jgi:hypothetical protein